MAEKKTEKWKSARTKNLSESQAKQAKRVVGGGRMEKVTAAERKAAKDFVNIGSTKWMTAKERGGKGRGGLLVDSSGKAVTGTVKLPSGQSAMYVRGKRVGVMRGMKKTDTGTSRSRQTSVEDKKIKETQTVSPVAKRARAMQVDRSASASIVSGVQPPSMRQMAERSRAVRRRKAVTRRRNMVFDPQRGIWVTGKGR